MKLTADTQYRYKVACSGRTEWGPGGTTAPDCILYRSGTNEMRFSNDLYIDGGTTIRGDINASNATTNELFLGGRARIDSTSTSSISYALEIGTGQDEQKLIYFNVATGNPVGIKALVGSNLIQFASNNGLDWDCDGDLRPGNDLGYAFGDSTHRWSTCFVKYLTLIDGITAPTNITGHAHIYVDTADGDLKVKFANGFVAVIAADS